MRWPHKKKPAEPQPPELPAPPNPKVEEGTRITLKGNRFALTYDTMNDYLGRGQISWSGRYHGGTIYLNDADEIDALIALLMQWRAEIAKRGLS